MFPVVFVAGVAQQHVRAEGGKVEQQSQMKVILRWVSFVPAALLAAWLAWLVVAFLNKVTMGMQGIDPNSFLSREQSGTDHGYACHFR
jgi:hypothetical protein